MKKITFLFAVITAIVFVGCSGDDPADVTVNFALTVEDEPLVYGKTYNINNTPVEFDFVAFFAGDVSFTVSNGSVYTSTDRYQLIQPGINNYNFTVPADVEDPSISGISLSIGVDEETNGQDAVTFDERPETDPLSNEIMVWDWETTGYRFLRIDAKADLDNDGEFEQPLAYHIGLDQYFWSGNLSVNEKLDGGDNNFELAFDLNQLFRNIDFETESDTHTFNDMPLANKVVANYQGALRFEKQ